MKIAVLSGKGGTGKTFISVNLAYAAQKANYIDCDVEEPNGWIFLKPKIESEEKVEVMLPKVDMAKCTACHICVDFCQYNAMALVKSKLLIFPELCHACGGCILLCPEKALKEGSKVIGKVEYGISGSLKTRTGILNTGEAVGIPVIQKLLENIEDEEITVIDSPPGSSCAAMESIRDADFCILVTEPTLFGVHNLSMVHELVEIFKKPYGVIINKNLLGENVAKDYCMKNNIPILSKIPYSNEISLYNSKGRIAAENPKYLSLFEDLLIKIREEVHQ